MIYAHGMRKNICVGTYDSSRTPLDHLKQEARHNSSKDVVSGALENA